MPPQRPTTLKLMTRHCPKALDHYEAGVPYDRAVFAVGSVAHDVLHALGVHGPDAVESTVLAMLAAGREGVDAEPPLPPDAVFEGRDLALAWFDRCDGFLGGPEARYELGLAFREDWTRTKYDDPSGWFRIRLDVLDYIEGDDEEYPTRGLVVRDYKSAWPTDASGLDTIQLRAQAVAAVKAGLADDVDFVRREVVNLRTGKVYSADTWLVEDAEQLEQWREDLELLIRAANVRPRVARPGAHCAGCPYVRACEAPRELLQTDDPERLVERYAAGVALVEGLEALAREATVDHAVVINGTAVGYQVKNKRRATDDAPDAIWNAWAGDADDLDERTVAVARGLVAAMKPGVSQVNAVARMVPHNDRDAFLERALEVDAGRVWGVARAAEFEEAPKPTRGKRKTSASSAPSKPAAPPAPTVPSVPGPPGAPL